MYTVEDETRDLYDEYDDEYDDDVRWYNRRGLIFKIIIIILCVIALIWLIKALKNTRNTTYNDDNHSANVEKIRLAAEEYFFIKDNKSKNNYISLAGLKKEGLINDIVDSNNKVCSDTGTNVNLDKVNGVYRMVIKFSCSAYNNDEIFYYHNNTLACLNCTGKTKMTGKDVVVAKADEKKEETSNQDQNNETEETYYSCINWSGWTKDRVYDNSLTERTKTLVQGVKYGKKTTYGEWSSYTTAPIEASDNIEIETKVVTESVWSENKTGTNIDVNNKNIRIVSKEEINGTSSCKDGYVKNDICYSNKVVVGNLTINEYKSNKYYVEEGSCESLTTIKNNDGIYMLTYTNCRYHEKIGNKEIEEAYTLYTYQELETKDIVYYRYRSINTVDEPNEYTDKKYEEQDLPNGFVKLPGTEETYYSYKLTECVK